MKQTDDTLLREALRHRAERLPMLPGDMAERVTERMGHKRQISLRLRPWVASISAAAAILAAVYIVWHEPNAPTATPQPLVIENVISSPIPPQGECAHIPISISKATPPQDEKSQVSSHSAPLSAERAGGEAVAALSLSELYASIDEMTDAALQEADRLMVEAIMMEVSDDRPS